MVRELTIEIYLTAVRLIFLICKLFPLRDKWTFMVSFPDNPLFIYEEMKRQKVANKAVFLYKGKHKTRFDRLINGRSKAIETLNLMDFFASIYHLATSKKVIIDNYYGLLAVTPFKKEVECIQIWHAAGAIKTFGLEDLSVQNRTEKASRRFQSVYDHFHKIVVGSDIMAERFQHAFNLPEQVILRTGVPRTDLFFDEGIKQKAIEKLYRENPLLQEKKVMLYAPTYRDQELDQFQLALDLQIMQAAFSSDYVLLVRLHPAIQHVLSFEGEGLDATFVFDYTNRHSLNELLFVTDLLITDYSSIPYEFSLLEKPMVFFAYDEGTYLQGRGLWEPYSQMVPGPIVRTTEELVEVVGNERFDLKEVARFAQKWNRYSDGHSSERIVHYLLHS